MTKNYLKKNAEWEALRDRLMFLKQKVEPRYLLEQLGFEISRETPKEIRCTCRIHGGDNPTSFRFNVERKTWVCFSHKCHETHGNDVIALIRACLGLDFMSAVEYLQNMTGDIGSGLDIIKYKMKREKEKFINNEREDIIPHYVSDNKVRHYMGLGSRLFPKEGFGQETLELFEVGGGYQDVEGFIRDVVPIRNDEGKLLAYSLRDVRQNVDYERKYWITPGFNKDHVLYNLHRIKDLAQEKPLIIVEGFKSVWRLHDYGIENVVAVMGSTVTEGQVNLLCQYALKGVVIMFDNDSSGIEGSIKAYEDLKNKMDVYPVFITEVDEEGKGLDPSDLSKEEALNYLKNYV